MYFIDYLPLINYYFDKKSLVGSLCEDIMYNLYTKNGNRLPYGHIVVIFKRLKLTESRLRRNMINNALINYWKHSYSTPKQVVLVPETSAKKNGTTGSVLDSTISELSNVSSFNG